MHDPNVKKLDPTLRQLLRRTGRTSEVARDVEHAPARKAERLPEMAELLVVFRGARADLEAAGLEVITVGPLPDGSQLASGRIPTMRLADLAAIDHVVMVDGGGHFEPELNFSAPEIGARSLHTETPAVTGAGVVIGIIDSGIDWRHGTFLKEDNTSRILAIWDQRLQRKAGETAGPGNIGVVYTRVQINDALKNTTPLRTNDTGPRNKDAGHGTHVAGIAAGDGSPNKCCGGGGVYVGVAPGADLIVVRLSSGATALGESARLIAALEYIFGHTDAQGKPIVVNISLGDNLGAHDGTSLVEQRIDALVTAGPGRVVVKSAGNEGASDRHVKAAVPANGSVELKFNVAEGDKTPRELDLWYPNGHELSLQIFVPNGPTSSVFLHGTDNDFPWNPSETDADRRGSVSIDWTTNAPINNDHNIRLTLRAPVKGTLPSGTWRLKLANAGGTPAEFHAWIERGDNTPTFLPAKPGDPEIRASNDTTISIPGTAREVIAVAHYMGRQSACDADSSRDIAPTSSRGPVRTNAASNAKPTVAAPGEAITSAMTEGCTLPGECCDCCPEWFCALYEDKSGTSMAAPHVAGAIALMFQVDPTLTRQQVVKFLEDSVVPRPVDAPKEAWGAGRIDVEKAVKLVREARAPSPTPAAPSAAISSLAAAIPTPADAAMPAALPFSGTVEILRALAREVPDGELCAALVSRHFSEVRRLVNTNRRVATLWHRGEGPALLRRLLHGAVDPTAPSPVASAGQRAYLERMIEQLRRHGSPRLQAALDRHGSVLLRLLDMPLAAQIASAAPEVYA